MTPKQLNEYLCFRNNAFCQIMEYAVLNEKIDSIKSIYEIDKYNYKVGKG